QRRGLFAGFRHGALAALPRAALRRGGGGRADIHVAARAQERAYTLKRPAHAITAATLWLFGCAAHAVMLSMEHAEAVPLDQVTLPINLTAAPGEDVSGVQFDLLFDTGALVITGVRVGPAAEAAQKAVSVPTLPDG